MYTTLRLFRFAPPLLLALLVALSMILPATAQAESLSKRFQDYFSSDFYQMLITSKWDQQARLICGESAGRSNLGLGQLIELDPVIGENGKPVDGAWIHRIPGNTCGKRRTFSFLVEFGSSGPLVITLLPGDTAASPLLQHDALIAATSLCQLKAKECDMPFVVDTTQGGPIPGTEGGWIEHWLFDACGQMAVVTMLFAPDGQGGTSFEAR